MMRTLYTLFFYLCLPGIFLRLLWRSKKNPAYRCRWQERLGIVPALLEPKKSIWLHAVSVGEFNAALPLIKALKQHYAHLPLVITTTTPTASVEVQKHLKDQVYHYYFPLDFPAAINRFIKAIKPAMTIIMETELWPNLLATLHQKNIPVVIANGRLSQRSMQGYRRLGKITREMMHNLTQVIAQTKRDGEHFLQLGLTTKQLTVGGNIKFDRQLPADIQTNGRELRHQWQTEHRPTLIAASTHEGEEAIVLDAFAKIQPQQPHAFLIIVPRHPERFSKVTELCKKRGFNTALRSRHDAISSETNILVGDTMGELCLFYATADIVFMGGTLAPVGGHNFIEPAALALPLLSGPQLHNFIEISNSLLNAKALMITPEATSIASKTCELMGNKHLAAEMGNNAKAVVIKNSGALQKHLDYINNVIKY